MHACMHATNKSIQDVRSDSSADPYISLYGVAVPCCSQTPVRPDQTRPLCKAMAIMYPPK